MTDMPERIWVKGDYWWQAPTYTDDKTEYVRADINRSLALDVIAADGQASEAYAAQMKAEVMAGKLAAALRRIVIHCDNSGIEVATVGERVAERCEDEAVVALAVYEASN